MEEQLVAFETAKLAKEKGFNIKCELFYNDKDLPAMAYNISAEESLGDNPQYNKYILAPTQSLLQKWLREIHGVHIQVYTMERWLENGNDMQIYFEVNLKTTHRLNGLSNIKFNMLTFKTYEEALEKGLQEALNLLPNI